MNNLLGFCILLWIVPHVGKDFFPTIFGNWYIQWPAIGILAVLLPIGFAKSLSNYFELKTKKLSSLSNPLTFLFMFCFLLFSQFPAHYAISSLAGVKSVSIGNDTNLLESIETGQTEEKRKRAAEIIFYEYGKKVPYRLDSGDYSIFEPTKNDIEEYEKNNKIRTETNRLRSLIANNSLQALGVQLIEIVCFFVFVSATLILEQKKANLGN